VRRAAAAVVFAMGADSRSRGVSVRQPLQYIMLVVCVALAGACSSASSTSLSGGAGGVGAASGIGAGASGVGETYGAAGTSEGVGATSAVAGMAGGIGAAQVSAGVSGGADAAEASGAISGVASAPSGVGATGGSGAADAGAAGDAAASGDPTLGRWTDLGETQAPAHEAAVAENSGVVTRGGTITFTNIGAPGYWGRRLEAEPGDPRCDVESRTIDYSWGGSEFCCRTKHAVTSDRLTPFNEQIALVLDGPLHVKQLAIYQPLTDEGGPWAIRSYWDRRTPNQPYNMALSGPNKVTTFSGDLGNNCSVFAMQAQAFTCGPGSDPYCPGSDLDYYGWAGSKLVVLLASMPYADDPALKSLSCIAAGQDERAEDSPWIGVAPSELMRDGWSGYHPCHCFSNTDGLLGDGCGQINVFEVIAESSGAQYGNRDVISTGVRSYQVGSLAGSTCGIASCGIDKFPADADLLDANALSALSAGAVVDADHPQMAAGPMWRRARDDRYYLLLLDENARTVQVAVIHPAAIPDELGGLLPALPNTLARSVVELLLALRLPR